MTADIEGSVSNFRLQSLTERHPSDLTKLLKNLVSGDLLERDGHGRGATYRWSERLRRLSEPSAPGAKEGAPGAEGVGLGASEDTPGATEDATVTDVPAQDPVLLKIASVARENRRLAPKKMQSVILKLCRVRELTGRDIAELVQRNQDRVLKSYLKPMLEQELLARKYPDDPNHPQQAYRSVAPEQKKLFDDVQ